MSELTKIVVNCETGEQEILPLTAEELAQLEADRQAAETARAEAEAAEAAQLAAKVAARAKLQALGLTTEEVSALIP